MVILAESGISLTDCASNSLQELELTFKKMAEMGNTQDLWDTDYPMPLTPPLSPITSFESTSSMSTDCDCHRFQHIYPSFNDVCNPGSVAQKFDSMVLKDCMWGFAKPNDTSRQPTAQLSNSVTSNAGTCFENTKLIGVDPTEVFPPSLFERVTNSDFTDSGMSNILIFPLLSFLNIFWPSAKHFQNLFFFCKIFSWKKIYYEMSYPSIQHGWFSWRLPFSCLKLPVTWLPLSSFHSSEGWLRSILFVI